MPYRISERDLILPSLYLMNKQPNGRISTSLLIDQLTKMMRPNGMDAAILPDRQDTYFSQKVRNLKSHDTLCKLGVAINVYGGFMITSYGKLFLQQNLNKIKHLIQYSR